jgi:hypothetical protein
MGQDHCWAVGRAGLKYSQRDPVDLDGPFDHLSGAAGHVV